MPGKHLYPTCSYKKKSVPHTTAGYRHFPLWRPVAWITIAAQAAFPLSVASAATVVSGQPETAEERKIAAHALSAGNILSAQQSDKAALNMARSAVTGEMGQSAKRWLDQFGTARLQLNFDERLKFDNSALDLLVPLYDNQDAMVYTQGGIRNKDDRNTGNIGAGIRTFYGDWMYGLNSFFDNDFTGKNRRAGMGAEAWTNNLKLSANSYFRLSGWRQSRDFADYNERPANGYDLRAEAFLPSHPQLGAKLMYERYRGDEVALFGKDNRQKDPYAMTTGLNYTPIPLLTLGAEHRQGKGGRHDSSVNLQMQYRLGESWRIQTDPTAVAAGRTLAGSRYDLVERNNHIVLDYKKQDIFRLRMPEQLSGRAGQSLTITAQVTGAHAMDRIEWDGAGLTAAGGSVAQQTPGTLLVTLPPFLAGGATNMYTLGATAYDKKGNASNRAHTLLSVSGHGISVAATSTRAAPDALAADGMSTSLLSIELKSDDNLPLSGLADALTLTPMFEAEDSGPISGARLAPSGAPTIGAITETANGVYSATLTAGNDPGQVIITPAIQGLQLTPIIINLRAGLADIAQSEFSVSSDTLAVGGNVNLTFYARDINGRFLPGLGERLQFVASPLDGITITAITESDDNYTAVLSGTASGTIKVIPVIDGLALTGLGKTITLLAGGISEQRSSFTMSAEHLVANGRDSVVLELNLRDEHGNAIGSSDAISFVPTPAGQFKVEHVSVVDGTHRVSLSGTQPGDYRITPSVGGVGLDGLAKSLSLLPVEVDGALSTFTISQNALLADDTDTVMLTFSARDAQGLAVTGVGEVLAFSASPNEGLSFSNISESNGVYSATLRGNKPGNISVMPSLYGVGMASLARDIELTPRAVKIKVSFDKTQAKAEEQITMLVEATYEDDTPATDVTLEITPQVVVNRQGGFEPATLLFNGLTRISQRITASDGKTSINITDPLGRGVKSSFNVSAADGEKTTGEVIFTVLTSPDSAFATYYGHMQASVGGLARPKLAGETGGDSVVFNYENWAVVTQPEANQTCTMPAYTALSQSYDLMKTNGWPLLPGSSPHSFIWSQSQMFNSQPFISFMTLSTATGMQRVIPQYDGSQGLLVCAD
ncbi:inverse autotransporter beta domain-containing protein [Acerihabitans sp.]|uniref:inverse autotransporter beta domain-containing protein n=1 Tax=Acerihabitans sp. TaxID=2811394 RepID=UPI002EDB0D29